MFRSFIIWLAASLLALNAWAGPLDDPLNEDAVRALIVEQFAAQQGVVGVDTLGPIDLKIRMADGASQAAFLGNVMRELRTASPADRARIIERFVTVIDPATMANDGLSLASLRLTVYPSAYIDNLRAVTIGAATPGNIDDFMPLRRAIAGELWLVLVEDTPQAVSAVHGDRLRKAGLSIDTAWAEAEANTRNVMEGLKIHEHGWVLSFEVDGYYENAMLAFTDFWDGMAEDLGGALLVASPARGIILVARDGDPEALKTLRDVAHEIYAERPHPLSTQILRRADGAWSVR